MYFVKVSKKARIYCRDRIQKPDEILAAGGGGGGGATYVFKVYLIILTFDLRCYVLV